MAVNLGDWLASSRPGQDLGLTTVTTSAIFLLAILVVAAYLPVPRPAVVRGQVRTLTRAVSKSSVREAIMLGCSFTLAAIIVALFIPIGGRHHSAAQSPAARATPSVSNYPAVTHFPTAEMVKIRAIVQAALVRVQAGDQRGARARITDLETTWYDDEPTLRQMDGNAWGVLDRRIDSALNVVRSRHPDPAAETRTLNELLRATD